MKNIKKLLFVLLLIPCLLFAGCSQDISAQEFEVLRGDAATNYYQNYYGKNMTITARIDREMSGTQSVDYGYNDDYILADYYGKMSVEQTIEVFDSGIEDMPNIRITTIQDVIDEGYEENELGDGIVSYTKSLTSKQVVTFVCNEVSGKKEVVVYLYEETNEIKNNGEPVCEIKKSSYTYPTTKEGEDIIEYILEQIDERIVCSVFENPVMLAESFDGKTEFFKSNGSAGWEMEISIGQVYDKIIRNNSSTIMAEISNDLPYKFAVEEKTTRIREISSEEYAKLDEELSQSAVIEFDCDPISKPQGFYGLSDYEPHVEILPVSSY